MVATEEEIIDRQELRISILLLAKQRAVFLGYEDQMSPGLIAWQSSILSRYEKVLANAWRSRQRALNSLDRIRQQALVPSV